MRNLWILLAILALAAITPAAAQKRDPLTGEVVEQAPPPKPAGPDLTEVNAKVRAQDYADAETILAGLQQEFPDDMRVLTLRGELLVALGRHHEAIPLLRKAAEIAPERPRVHFQLGTALASSGQGEAAIGAFGKELEYSKDAQVRLLAHLNRSMLFQKGRQWSDATAELEAAMDLDPSRTQAWGDLVSLHIEAGNLDGALMALERGAAAGFHSARHYYSVGARLFKESRYADARAAFLQVLEIEPTHARAVRSLAASCEELGQDEQALEQWARYLELAPGATDAEEVSQKLRAGGKL